MQNGAPGGEGSVAPRPRRSRRRTIGLVVLGLVIGIAGWGGWSVWALPDVGILRDQAPVTTAYIEMFRREEPRVEPQQRWVPYAAISPHLKRAVLVSEDINFFFHDGFDSHEIGEAVRVAWNEKEFPRGASTLTQQLARNLYLSPSRSPWRKLREAVLTRRLERELTKRRILEIYLNVVEFGPGIYGAEAASEHYFGLPAAVLTERQAAELAVVLPRPSVWHPGRETAGYQAAVERTLRRMEKAEFLWKRI